MGLPLFVAPVESDVPSQIGDKSAATRQARSSIRRARRNVDSRPFRRRAALLRDNFPTPGPEPVPRARYPWIESGYLPPPEAYIAPPPRTLASTEADRGAPTAESTELRDALREMRSRGVERGPEASEARLISLFGERWAFENLPQPSRTNATPPSGEEQSNWQEPERPQGDGIATYPYPPIRRFRRAQLDRMSMPAPPVAARFDRSPEHSVSARFSGRRPRVDSRTGPPNLNQRTRRIRASGHLNESSLADGLGDRDRSLSPDEDGVWDTLLTTLTPDPQPPSAGSSFASATASASASASQSQSAAASSRTSLTGPETTQETLEQPCESGVDNSDDEAQEDMLMGRGWPDHWTMNYPSRHRRFVADLDANNPSRISYMRQDSGSYRRSDGTSVGPSAHDDEEMRTRRRLELLRHYRIATRDPTPLPELLDHIVRDSSEETGGTGDQRDGDGDGDAAPSSHNHTSNDNALHGMQMIVRNLARREDIPDEWWAGAGLSRTLPEEP